MGTREDDSSIHLLSSKDLEAGFGYQAVQDDSRTRPLDSRDPRSNVCSRNRHIKVMLCLLVLYGLLRLAVFSVLDSETLLVVPGGLEYPFLLASSIGEPYIDYDFAKANVEKSFLSVPNPKSALASSRSYATHPHLAGSTEDYQDALTILELFQKEWGISPPREIPQFPAGTPESRNATLNIGELKSPTAWIDVYYPIMNTGLERKLQVLDSDKNVVWDADLVEDGDPGDPEAAKYRDYIPTWHGLSKDGDVQGQLIYANYGTQEDYQNLLSVGTDFKGKIVLVRYGAIFRGLKIKGAQELGAAGVIIYSDPRDDGFVTVENGYEPYPAGPARNPTSVQRGSVQFISLYPGDPTTPGYPAYENATRTEAENIPKIPSLPISWANAQRLLAEIDSSGRSQMLTGKASERVIRLMNRVDTKVMPIWNTMAAIPGHIKSETVMIGVHRDGMKSSSLTVPRVAEEAYPLAWVMGAADPISGTVSLIEVIKGLGVLLESGWKPLRNILIASWDAEEYGLVGSTEWAEDFSEWISANVVTYLNLDVSVAGSRWVASASPSLAHLIGKTAKDIPHPTDPGRSLWDAGEDEGPFKGPTMHESENVPRVPKPRSADTGVSPLGSGSDFTVFLQRLGIASMDQGFAFTPSDAVYHYHSIYDSQHWQELYADPTFSRHVAVAKHLGLMVLRFADAITLPLNTTQYALELDDYLDRVEAISSSAFPKLRKSIKSLQTASMTLDIEKTEAEKKFKDLLSQLPRRKSSHSEIVYQRITEHPMTEFIFEAISPITEFIKVAKRVQKANSKLIAFEKGFISEEGIKDREWYRHLGVAPGKWLGYGATTLPGITEALTIEKNTTLAKLEAKRLAELIDGLTHVLTA